MNQELFNWLKEIEADYGKPDSSISALNFGLIETENGYSSYLIGAEEYDEDDDDWACEEDYAPEPRYLPMQESYSDLDWEQTQQKFSEHLKNFIGSELANKTFLTQVNIITTGFDDGELIRVK